jgi:flagellar biosynthesis protein FlhF
MRVKTFEAVDMKQALQLVREQLGPAAVIVSSRSVRRDAGLFGLIGRKVLEVTAAAEEAPSGEPVELQGSRAPQLPDTTRAPLMPAGARARSAAGRTTGVYHDIWAVKQAVDPVLDEVRALRESLPSTDERSALHASELRSDLAQIRGLLGALASSPALGADPQGAAAQRLFYFLLARGIDESLARSLVQRVVSRVETGSLGDLERLKLNLAAEMRADLSRAERGAPPSRVQVFVGPTGVGKTTTIAKLAARAQRALPGSVLVITTDVHRVAAVEQMVRFGELISVPVEVAIGPDDLARAIARGAQRDQILIDTAGRSPRDPSAMTQLRALIAAAGECEVMLVASATTRSADSADLLEAYAALPWSRLILTKLDETRVFGELYNDVVRSGRPIACATNGQSVPEHLESLDVPGILRRVLQG